MSWIDLVDRVLVATDRALDRVRKSPRRRLEVVPEPLAGPDPFVEAPAPVPEGAAEAPLEVPLGDPGLIAQVYGRRTDDASGQALKLLREAGVTVRFVDLDDPDFLNFEARLIRETKQVKLPYVYLRGTLIGDYEALKSIERRGELEERLGRA